MAWRGGFVKTNQWNTNETDATEAMSCLSQLYKFNFVDGDLIKGIPEQHCYFVKVCMKVLEEKKSIPKIIVRCLQMITVFIQNILEQANKVITTSSLNFSSYKNSPNTLHFLSHAYKINSIQNLIQNSSSSDSFFIRIQTIGFKPFEILVYKSSSVKYL